MSETDPYPTAHALDRWDERTNPGSVSPETAWAHSQRHDGATAACGVPEVRLHPPTGALLLRDGFRIVTVLTEDEIRDATLRRSVADASTTDQSADPAEP